MSQLKFSNVTMDSGLTGPEGEMGSCITWDAQNVTSVVVLSKPQATIFIFPFYRITSEHRLGGTDGGFQHKTLTKEGTRFPGSSLSPTPSPGGCEQEGFSLAHAAGG